MKSQVARYKHVGTVDRGKIHVLIDFRVLRKREVQQKLADTQFWATLQSSRLIAIATTKEHSNPPSYLWCSVQVCTCINMCTVVVVLFAGFLNT